MHSQHLPTASSQSLWIDDTPGTTAPLLQEDVSTEVAVVGGGIAGITAAKRLAEAGREVLVLEAARILQGVTGHTTAKLTSQHGLVYADLIDTFGEAGARAYAEANEAAIEAVADRVQQDGIECNFEREPAYTYVEDEARVDEIHDEVEAARQLGLPATFVEDPPLPFEVPGAVRFDDQALFHPRRYLLALAEGLDSGRGGIRERARVVDVDEGEPCTVSTESHEVEADHVLVTTHFPISDRAGYFARMRPKKSYVLAARLAGGQPEGMHYRDADEIFSVRPRAGADEDLVLFTGENHRTGDADETARYERLEETVREGFDVEEIAYRWSTQDYVSFDQVPFVGPAGPTSENVYVATGFGGWGMTNGIAAGRMLADAVLDEEADAFGPFDPNRVKVEPEAAGGFLSHNMHAAKAFVSDRLSRLTRSEEVELDPGEGQIVRRDGEALAAFRDREGNLHVHSAVCPHMGCEVKWNEADETWDCPCHGSRFRAEGDVIDGPAVDSLQEERV